jgi:hypothetical protein
LFSRSLYLVADFPITGGGLGSFPGLFSQYLLNIPYYYLPNSHNLFLDVAIEQGLIGGLLFLFFYTACLWSASGSVAIGRGDQGFQWILIFSLLVAIVHGMVDNYLYNGTGSMFSLFLVGLSMNERRYDEAYTGFGLSPGRAGVLAMVLSIMMFAVQNPLRSVWYANVGAIQLAKTELDGFPNNGWTGSEIVPRLSPAESTLRYSLHFDRDNRTAHHRLGLISMMRADFESASRHLEIAHEQAPGHRGIIKSLGYCYVWLGNLDDAQRLLSQIPEAKDELGVYVWWWSERGRNDLSDDAFRMISRLGSGTTLP